MAELFQVAVVNGKPVGGSGDAYTINQLMAQFGTAVVNPAQYTLLDRVKAITDKLNAGVAVSGTVGISGGTVGLTGGTTVAVSAVGGTVTVGGTVGISGTVPVSGTVALAAGAAAIGSVSITGTHAVTVTSGNITLAAGAAAIGTVGVTGTVTLAPLPAGTALIGNTKAFLHDGAGTAITSATRGAERALSCQIVDAAGVQITSFGGGAGGGTSSNFSAAVPAAGTAAGFSDGTNMVPAKVGDVNNVAAATGFQDSLAIGRYDTTQPSLTNGRFNALQLTSKGALIVNPGSETFSVGGTVALAAGAAAIGTVGVTGTVTLAALPTGGNTIGAVNIAAAQTLATVTTVGTVSTVTDNMHATNFVAATTQTIASANTAQALFPTAAVNGFEIWNLDDNVDLWISIQGAAVIGAAGSFPLGPKEHYWTPDNMRPNNAGSIISTLAGHKFTAHRY